jgi:hypothetical protein
MGKGYLHSLQSIGTTTKNILCSYFKHFLKIPQGNLTIVPLAPDIWIPIDGYVKFYIMINCQGGGYERFDEGIRRVPVTRVLQGIQGACRLSPRLKVDQYQHSECKGQKFKKEVLWRINRCSGGQPTKR